jgi:hypothetical protein
VLPRRAKDSDTDPSTPEAIRGPAVDTDPGLGPGGRPASTDPGLGHPPPPLVPLAPAVATPTPVTAAVGSKKDSVELLLEGMPIQQPQPPRTMPQTAGQASASYHAEHAVRPAHTSPDDMPKVVVERAPQHSTVRLDRARIQAVIDQAHAEKAAREEAVQSEPPPAGGLPLGLRIAIAVVAGLAVVLCIFLFARPAAPGAGTIVAPPPPAVATVRPPPVVTAQPAPTASDTSQSSTPPATTDTVSTTPAAPPPVTTSVPRPRPRSTGPAAPAPGGSADLGEFKTTFH